LKSPLRENRTAGSVRGVSFLAEENILNLGGNDMSTRQKVVLYYVLIVLAVCGFGSQEYFPDDPFAPTVEPPRNIENRGMWLDMIGKWDIPTRGEVGIPAFPNAYIIQVQQASTMQVDDKTIKTLPVITLATVDQPEKVVNFYREKLKGWNYSNDFMTRAFWEQDSSFDPLDPRKTATVPNVIIYDIGDDMPEVLLPKARSRIKITYIPQEI